jgi:hypothetical protein
MPPVLGVAPQRTALLVTTDSQLAGAQPPTGRVWSMTVTHKQIHVGAVMLDLPAEYRRIHCFEHHVLKTERFDDPRHHIGAPFADILSNSDSIINIGTPAWRKRRPAGWSRPDRESPPLPARRHLVRVTQLDELADRLPRHQGERPAGEISGCQCRRPWSPGHPGGSAYPWARSTGLGSRSGRESAASSRGDSYGGTRLVDGELASRCP